jgi:predicted transcriptional regulator
VKTTNLDDYVQKERKDPDFKTEYDALEEEFTIAQEVIALRLEAHMTQKQLAERVGTSQPAIARLESGNYKNLSLAFLRRVARALGSVPEVHLKKRGA